MNKHLDELSLQISQSISQSVNPVLDAWHYACNYIGLTKNNPWQKWGELFSSHPDLQYSPNAYHNHYHAAEAVISAAVLLKEEFNDNHNTLSYYGPILLFSMLCHDLEHSGGHNNYPYELEEKSYLSILQFFNKNNTLNNFWNEHLLPYYGQWDSFNTIIKEIILGTEFTHNPQINAKNYLNSSHHVIYTKNNILNTLKLLANEADILPSCLKYIGEERGIKLSLEQNNPKISSNEGRLYFLSHLANYHSKASQILHIKEYIHQQIEEINTIQKSGKMLKFT